MRIKYISFLAGVILAASLQSCKNDDPRPENPVPVTRLLDNTIHISDIQGVPSDIIPDRVEAVISGYAWSEIGVVSAPFSQDGFTLTLPVDFEEEELCKVTRDKSTDYYGFWPGLSDDPAALVAGLGDIRAFKGDKLVGMIYLSDWSGVGSSGHKAFVYYHYTDRPYNLSGGTPKTGNGSYYKFSAFFTRGWNPYINYNVGEEGEIRTTTDIDPELQLNWYFKSYVK